MEKYKKTNIGLIPSNWSVLKFTECCYLKHGFQFREEHFSDVGIPVIKIGSLIDGGNIRYDNLTYIHSKHINDFLDFKLSAGDILMALTGGTLGKISIFPETQDLFFQNYRVGNFFPLNNAIKKYIFFLMQSYFVQQKIQDLVNEAAQPNIGKQDFDKILVPLPPLSEQQKIAEILSTWDDVIVKYKGIIENLQVRNIGLEQQLLSGKMRLKGYEKSQWHLKSVEEVAVFKNGKAHENCIDENGDYFVVNSKFISTQGKVAKASNENLCPLFKNDITMVMSDIPNGKALAKCFYIPEDDKYTLNQRICALTAKDGTDSKFLYYQMNRNNYYLAFNNGVSQTNLKKEEVLECPLLMPDIEEQIQIVKVLETADQELKSYEAKLEALQLQKKGLMQQLLTGKIRVNVK